MRKGLVLSVFAVAVISVLARVFLVTPLEAVGQTRSAPNPAGSSGTHVMSVSATNGGEYVVIVDTSAHVLGSYHVNPENGHISLRSVRSYQWDLQMNDFNGADPRPNDVRTIIEQR